MKLKLYNKTNNVRSTRVVYQQSSYLWIVMEYVGGGSALDLLKPGPMEEDYIAIILRDVLKGLEYLHNERKLHRDIKGQWSVVSGSSQY